MCERERKGNETESGVSERRRFWAQAAKTVWLVFFSSPLRTDELSTADREERLFLSLSPLPLYGRRRCTRAWSSAWRSHVEHRQGVENRSDLHLRSSSDGETKDGIAEQERGLQGKGARLGRIHT